MLIECFDCDVGDQSKGWSKGAEGTGAGSVQKPATALGILLPAVRILKQLWQEKICCREKIFQLKKELRRFSHNSKFTLAKVALKSARLGAGGGGHFDILWVKCSQEV